MTTFFPTFRFDANVTLSGKPTVIVPELSETVVSFAVPAKVIVPPNAVAVELEPSVTVIVELVSLELAIEPANIEFSTDVAAIVNAPVSLTVASPDTAE